MPPPPNGAAPPPPNGVAAAVAPNAGAAAAVAPNGVAGWPKAGAAGEAPKPLKPGVGIEDEGGRGGAWALKQRGGSVLCTCVCVRVLRGCLVMGVGKLPQQVRRRRA